jgi:HEAT repeat protein
MAAAKQLHREHRPHDPTDEHPEIVDVASRVASSNLEPDVRTAAVRMLASYGDASAVPPLLAALNDPVTLTTAVHALFYIAIYIKDPRIANGLVPLLATPQDNFLVEYIIHILEDLQYVGLPEIALRLLDGDIQLAFNFSDEVPDAEFAKRFHTRSAKTVGAFAFAKSAENPTPELIARLKNRDPQIRAAAVAAIREDKNKGPHLAKDIKPLVTDSDDYVRQQAATTLRSLEPLPSVEISPEQAEKIEAEVARLMQRAKNRKSRF